MELQFHPDPAALKLSVWHITLLCVQWITPDDGQRNCPRHVRVEFHFPPKFEKLVNPVGFIIRYFVTMHGHMNVKNAKYFTYYTTTLHTEKCGTLSEATEFMEEVTYNCATVTNHKSIVELHSKMHSLLPGPLSASSRHFIVQWFTLVCRKVLPPGYLFFLNWRHIF
jgi:hypothetical protein